MSLSIHNNIKLKLLNFLKLEKIPNILFYGPHGTGKKKLIEWFIEQIYGTKTNKQNLLFVNCYLGKGIKFVREELKLFAKTNLITTPNQASASFKTIILSNADILTIDAQSALRRCIELFSHNTRFFMILRDKNQIMNPILSRFCEIYIPIPKIDNTLINLHSIELENAFQLGDETKKRELKLQKNLSDFLKKNENYDLEKIKQKANQYYEKGVCGLDVMNSIKSNFYKIPSIELRQKEIEFIIFFDKIRKEIRCEKTVIFMLIVMNLKMFYENNPIDLTNMSLIC